LRHVVIKRKIYYN